MLGGCSDALSAMVPLGMYQLPYVGVGPILVCKPLKVVNGHLSTRLETRTKESNACVSFRVVKLRCVLKEIVGISSPATNQAIV